MKEANKKGRHLLTKSFIKRHYKMLEKFKKSIKYLKCDIQPGMYSSEKTISFENSKGNTISGFFPNEVIKQDKLEVIVLKARKNKSLITPSISSEGAYGFIGCNLKTYVDNKYLLDIPQNL